MKKATKPTGNLGEKLAAEYLRKKKHRILKSNYRLPIGEIDLLTNDQGSLVIVEVKTKTTDAFGHPAEMVNFYKQRKLLQLARYCQKLYPDSQIRLDVVSVDLSQNPPLIEHIENAIQEN